MKSVSAALVPNHTARSLFYYAVLNLSFLSGPKVIKLFPCSTQLSTKFILLMNVQMPTIVGILTFINMINATSERLKPRNFFICRYFSFYEQLKFVLSRVEHEKSCINSGPGVSVMCLNLTVPLVDLKCLIVAFPGDARFCLHFQSKPLMNLFLFCNRSYQHEGHKYD